MTTQSPDDFRNMVVRRRDACVKFNEDKPSKDRREALQFYRGDNLDLYGDSADGLSAVVSRDTMEAVESMMPALVKPFVAGEEVVSFSPVGPEDEDGAAQATDYINHVFSTHNNAFRVIHDAMKDGLLYRLGVAKTVMEECEDGGPEKYEGIDQMQLEGLLTQGSEIAGDLVQDPETGMFTVTIAPKKIKKYRVYIVSPDEFLYEPRLANLDQATFLGHSKQVTLGDLIDMGVSKKKAMALTSGRPNNGDETNSRFRDERDNDNWETDDLARPVWVDECFVRCDKDNSGVLEWRKVLLGGSQSTMLLDEDADGHPYSTWTPIPVPHKLVGLSMHDMTRDIQMNKTALQREMNNNAYLTNRPQQEVLDGMVNMDDLLNPSVGSKVRVKQMGSIQNLTVPFVAQEMFPLIEYLDGVREARTGVTRYNQGMDSNSLNKTATGMSIISNASQQRQELIARQFAEFLKDVFHKLLKLVSLHSDQQEVIRLRGKWVPVDPSEWKTNYDMNVSVGLGTNNKDQLVGQIMQLMQVDAQIIQLQQGANGPLVTMQNIYEKLKRLVEAMGLKGIDKYYSDPGEEGQPGEQQNEQPGEPADQQQPPQHDPAMEMQGKLQMHQQKLQQDAVTAIELAKIKAQSDANVAAIKGQYDVAKETAKPIHDGAREAYNYG